LDLIFDWLGVDRQSISMDAIKPHNQKPADIQGVAGMGLLNRIQYSRVWNKLSPLFPSQAKNWAKRLAYKEVDEAQIAADMDGWRRLIGPTVQGRLDKLCRLLNRDFPEWGNLGDRLSPLDAVPDQKHIDFA
jgi:hypothetical protein